MAVLSAIRGLDRDGLLYVLSHFRRDCIVTMQGKPQPGCTEEEAQAKAVERLAVAVQQYRTSQRPSDDTLPLHYGWGDVLEASVWMDENQIRSLLQALVDLLASQLRSGIGGLTEETACKLVDRALLGAVNVQTTLHV